MNLRKKIDAIWKHAGPDPKWRYIPRHNGHSAGGWNVFDRKLDRFLTDREVRAIPVKMIEAEHVENTTLH